MAYDLEIRFRCRALFEVLEMTLSDISKQENVPVSTLSEWKNDDREEYGGIWLKGAKAANVEKAQKKLREELQATSVYDEMKKSLHHHGVTKGGELKADGILSIASDNAELQAQVETDMIMLASVMLSSILLTNQVKKDITKVRQSDIKTSSNIHLMAKQARFDKTPDTVIFNHNGQYSIEELEKILKQKKAKGKKY